MAEEVGSPMEEAPIKILVERGGGGGEKSVKFMKTGENVNEVSLW